MQERKKKKDIELTHRTDYSTLTNSASTYRETREEYGIHHFLQS